MNEPKDINKSISEIEKGYGLAIKHKKIKPNLLSKICESLGTYYYLTNNFEKSIEHYLEVIKYAKSNSKIASSYRTISTITYLFGDFEKAINFANKGLLYSQKDNFEKSDLYNIISNCYSDIENYPKSLENIKKAIYFFEKWELENKQNDYLTAGLFILNLGNNYKFQNNKKAALNNYIKATNLFEKSNNYDKLIQNGLVNQGDILEQMNRYSEAKKIYAYAEKLKNEKLPNEKDGYYARINGNLAKINANEKDFELAISNFKKAFEMFPNFDISRRQFSPKNFLFLKDKAILQDILTDFGNCYKSYFLQSKIPNYLSESARIFKIVDSVIEAMRQEHSGNQSKLFWRKNTRHFYESAIETCLLLKDYEKAFYFFEKSRSVMLNDKLNEMGAKQKLSVEDQKKEREFISKILALNADIEKEKDAKKRENLISKQNDLVESQSQFTKSLETKNPSYYQMKYDTTTVSLEQMQNYLKTNFKGKPATLVEYFVGDSATYAFLISANKTEIRKITYDENLAKNFLRFTSKKLNTKAELDSFQNISLALNNQLIKPLNIKKGHLIISQDGNFLPFEALSNSTKKDDFLINDHPISYTYSAQFLLKNKSEKSFLPTKNFIGFAPINFPDLASLNGSKKSISNLAAHYFFNTKLIENEATKNNFLTQANQYKIVQLYTHAQADGNETEPKIYFADSTLKVSELSAENKFKTQLLVLSACKTGVGKLAKGEGILSLARGFSMLGIPATITSLWSVEDADVYTITELFYTYLNQGFAKDEALQKAKIEFLKNAGNTQPYAWAGLVLVGETEPIGNSKSYLWFFAFLLLLILALIWFRKQRLGNVKKLPTI